MCAHQTTIVMPSTALNIAEIVDRYTGLLQCIGRRYRLNPEEREDAAQSTWLALCRNAEHIRDPERIPGWLATTMGRFCAATLRQRDREQPASNLLDTDTYAPSEASPDIVDTVAARQVTRRLYQAIAQLSDRERRLIQLQLDPAQPGYAQISRTIPMPVGSIGPVRGRAIHRLRTLLHDLE
jgi:RNA polymerase sigma factor (sigma-70 family)